MGRCRIIAEKFKKKHPSVYVLSVRNTVYVNLDGVQH